MKKRNRSSKKNAKQIITAMGEDSFGSHLQDIMNDGKAALDGIAHEMGKRLVEAMFYFEREVITGPDYDPQSDNFRKNGSSKTSVYLGSSKVRVRRPRINGPTGEVPLSSYKRLREPGRFGEQVMAASLAGMSLLKCCSIHFSFLQNHAKRCAKTIFQANER